MNMNLTLNISAMIACLMSLSWLSNADASAKVTLAADVQITGFTVFSALLTADNSTLYVAGGTKDVGRLIKFKAPFTKAEYDVQPHTAYIYSIALSSDEKTLASAGGDDLIKISRPSDLAEVKTLKGHTGAVYGVSLDRSGSLLASCSEDGTVRIWDVQLSQNTKTMAEHTSAVKCVCLNESGMVVSGEFKNTLNMWRIKEASSFFTFSEFDGSVASLSMTAAGDAVVLGGLSNKILALGVPSGKLRFSDVSRNTAFREVAISSDCSLIAASENQTIKIWSAHEKRFHVIPDAHSNFVTGLRFSPDGTRLVSLGWDKHVKVWTYAE